MNTGHHLPRLPQRHKAKRHPSPASAPPKVPSAARLAAEALFTAREDTLAVPKPVTIPIVVLKKRGPSAIDPAADSSGPLQPQAAHDTPAPGARTPRVFTLSPPATAARTVERDPLLDPAPLSQGSQEPAATEARPSRRATRSDRIGHDTRSRVIRHVKLMNGDSLGNAAGDETVMSAADEPQWAHAPFDTAPRPAAAENPDALESPASLLRQLAKVEGIFAAIRTARAFTLVDEGAEQEWLRLSRRADQIARDLKALEAQPA